VVQQVGTSPDHRALSRRATYFFGTRVVGTSRIPPHGYAPDSLAWFCQVCGDLWARALVEGSETSWRVEVAPCAKHAGTNALDWSRVPGSLSQGARLSDLGAGSWARALEALPPELQNREVLCFINHLERSEHASQ